MLLDYRQAFNFTRLWLVYPLMFVEIQNSSVLLAFKARINGDVAYVRKLL